MTLREQALHRTSSSDSKYVPYRNSILTSMLRDSLGGNCKSCFIINISVDRLQFEETVASCRFGARCGEVRVKVVANTEIGLTDQLKELSIRVRALERQLISSEEQRRQTEALLSEERALRIQQSELRILTAQEKIICKNCVQQLLTKAKDAVLSCDLAPATSSTEERMRSVPTEAVIEQSQQSLYHAVEGMDKAVLIELSTALGGLVQSMFIERELMRQETATDEALRRRTELEVAAAQAKDSLSVDVLKRGRADELATLRQLPEARLRMIRTGAIFVKHGWMGKKTVRHVSVSDDLKTLHLLCVGAAAGKKQDSSFVNLSAFER